MKEFAKTRIITIFVANKTMKMEIEIENHPLQPFLPVKARLLMPVSYTHLLPDGGIRPGCAKCSIHWEWCATTLSQ